ncbi:MAG: hypothetical protein RL120_00705 [Gammaproteobacteria bacterium]
MAVTFEETSLELAEHEMCKSQAYIAEPEYGDPGFIAEGFESHASIHPGWLP